MACCFRMFGATYIQQLIKPHIEMMLTHNDSCYEVDPNRLEGDINMLLAAHRKNLEMMTQRLFDSIISSVDRIPSQVSQIFQPYFSRSQ